jgi:signal transduction histidine kinase
VIAFDQLRALAATNPKAARSLFQQIAARSDTSLNDVLTLASRPGEGRVRQAVALFYKVSGDHRLEKWLSQWLAAETDEFTKRAIEAALSKEQVERSSRQSSRQVPTTEAYRYYASRLCHQVRNAMSLPDGELRRLERLAQSSPDLNVREQLTGILVGLRAGFSRIARSVEFDLGDDYMAWNSIQPCQWFATRAPDLAGKFGKARLVISGTPESRRCAIRASAFLLDIVFSNVWANAIQVVESGDCTIEMQAAINLQRKKLSLTFVDNGAGFPEVLLETAFLQSFSTHGPGRGRGLLEVDDAVNRLGGIASLKPVRPNEYRLNLEFPIDRI